MYLREMEKGPYKKSADARRTNYVYAWRAHRDMTQDTLAERVCCATSTISQVETGTREPSLPMLRLIAKALGVEAGWLLSRDPDDAADPWAIVEAVRTLPPERRRIAERVLQVLTEG